MNVPKQNAEELFDSLTIVINAFQDIAQNSYNQCLELQRKYEELQNQYNGLKNQYDILENQYRELKSQLNANDTQFENYKNDIAKNLEEILEGSYVKLNLANYCNNKFNLNIDTSKILNEPNNVKIIKVNDYGYITNEYSFRYNEMFNNVELLFNDNVVCYFDIKPFASLNYYLNHYLNEYSNLSNSTNLKLENGTQGQISD